MLRSGQTLSSGPIQDPIQLELPVVCSPANKKIQSTFGWQSLEQGE